MVDRTRELEPREGAPIGWDGKTATEMLEEPEQRFAETGSVEWEDPLVLPFGEHLFKVTKGGGSYLIKCDLLPDLEGFYSDRPGRSLPGR